MNKPTKTRPTIAIIIPALNEEQTIGDVLQSIPKEYSKQIIVVDSNSTDNTGSIAKSFGVKVLVNSIQTYDHACILGASASNADILVFLHAGGDDETEDMDKLLQPIVDNSADLVMGSRVETNEGKQSLDWKQLLGTSLIISLINVKYNTGYKDLGPYRAIRYTTYEKLQMKSKGFSFTTQMLIKALRGKHRVIEVNVHSKKRVGRSKISGSVKYSFLAMRDMLWSFQFMFYS